MPKAPAKKKKTSKAKHPGGRPTKYKPEYCQQIIEFIKAGGDEIKRPTVVSLGAKAGSEIVDHVVGKLPGLFQDFALEIGVTMECLSEWCKVYPEFSESYKKAKKIQESQMIVGGTSGAYQQAFTIFMLKNCHGWRDKTDVEHSGKIDGPLIYLPTPNTEQSKNGQNNGSNGHHNGSKSNGKIPTTRDRIKIGTNGHDH